VHWKSPFNFCVVLFASLSSLSTTSPLWFKDKQGGMDNSFLGDLESVLSVPSLEEWLGASELIGFLFKWPNPSPPLRGLVVVS